jgi:RimJ/RimL family protein N-acetyltransferase
MFLSFDVNNVRSKKITERLCFTLEGRLKANRKEPLTAKISDTLIYAKYALSGLPDIIVEWGSNDEYE